MVCLPRFIEEQVDKKFKSIIVDTGGQAPRSTRTLLKRLHDELSLPVVILTDGDVYGRTYCDGNKIRLR